MTDEEIEVAVLAELSRIDAHVALDRRVLCLENWWLEPGETHSLGYLVHQAGFLVLEIPVVRAWAHTLREMIRSRDLPTTSVMNPESGKPPEIRPW